MSRSRTLSAAVCWLLGGLLARPIRCSEFVRLGAEFQVNSYTSSSDEYSAVAMDADGDFVVVWHSNHDGIGSGVFARRYNSAGAALGTDFEVNTFTGFSQLYPTVAMDDGGDFVVAWQSYSQDGAGNAIIGRRFSANGTSLASEFLVNSYVSLSQDYASAAMDSDGDFVIAWRSSLQDGDSGGVFARRFSSAGTALAGEFQVNSYTPGMQTRPRVAMDAAGRFVVAWESYGQDGDNVGVFVRRFSSTGLPLATEFQLSTHTFLAQRDPAIDFDGQGDFVIAWSDNSLHTVYARRFTSAGDTIGTQFRVNAVAIGQHRPAVGVASDGEFVVAWEVGDDGSGEGIFARRFDSSASSGSAEFQVNSYTPYSQYSPRVAMESGGDFVVAWFGENEDGFDTGVFAQRLRAVAALDVDGNGQISPLTDGLLTLRFEFGFTGATLVTGAVDLVGCTRCDAPAIITYLQTML